jgi:MFS family permease
MTLESLRLLLAAGPTQLRVVTGGEEPGGPVAPSPLPPPSGFRRGFSALRHTNFRIYWFGMIVSLIGTWMQSVSQPWLVLLLGGSPLQVGAVIALQFAPAMFLAPLGGVLADRVDKRRTLMATQAAAMGEALVLFSLTFTGVVEIWHIFVLAGVLGIVNAVDMPVRQSFAAELVPRSDLMNAIALNSASFNLARVLGPAVAGLALAIYGPAFNFGVNALSYLAVLVALWMMNPRALHRSERPAQFASVWTSLGEGVRYARRTPTVLWPLVLLAGMATFGMNFQTLLPLFARHTLALDADGYGLLFAAMGFGSLLGSLTLAFAGSRRPMLGLILGGALAFVIFEVALGLSRSPLAAYPVIVVVGFASMLMVNTINVTVQSNVPNELRGRVMSLYVTVFAGSAPIGGFFAGAVAEVWDAPAAFLLGAAISTAFIGLVAWKLLFSSLAWTDAALSTTTRDPSGVPPAVDRRAANE